MREEKGEHHTDPNEFMGRHHSGHHLEQPHRSGLSESEQSRAESTGVRAAGAEEEGPGSR